jgi:hypothetical protein
MAHSPAQTGLSPQPSGCTVLPGSTTRSNVFSSIQPSDTGFNRKVVAPWFLKTSACPRCCATRYVAPGQDLEMTRTLSDR